MQFKRLPFITVYVILFITLSSPIFSQSISGKVIDAKAEVLPYANILLLNALDSSLVKGELSDEQGNFRFEVSSNQAYLISASYVGYIDFFSEAILSNEEEDHNLNDIILSEGVSLDEIQIVAKKPLFEQKIDRLVVNVASSVTSAGGTALEVLEKSPGVNVNRQSGALSLIGKQGVVIMINGKVTYQPAESIVQMLEGMSADNIEKIELITTPPANFDAEGNAGFINIVLKTITDLGLNGNISASVGYGEGETGSANLNLNYRKNKLNVYSTYSFSRQAQKQIIYNFREVDFNSINTTTEVTTDRSPIQQNHNFRVGMDYQLGENTIIGVVGNAYNNKWTMEAFNIGTTQVNNMLESNLDLSTVERNQWKHAMGNVNLEHKMGSNQKIIFNLDYLKYEDENPNDYITQFYDNNNNLLSAEETRSRKFTPITIQVGQVDYENNINEKVKVVSGIKAAISTFENKVSTELLQNGDWELIDQFTNESDLNEKIFAAYTAVDWNINENNLFKIGLRYENTDSKLNTIKDGVVVDREFGKIFPSVFYSRTISENQSVNLSYNKRITRPTFNDMAPFAIFLDPSTFFFGNAKLQPAIADNYKMDYRYKSYLFSVQYSKEDSTIASFQERIDLERNQQQFEPINLSNMQLLSGSISIPIYIGNRWSMQNNFLVLWSESNSFYNEVPVQLRNTNYNINSTQSFTLGQGYSTELSGFYQSSSLSGRYATDATYAVNFGLQKKLDNGSSIRFNIRDIFDSFEFNGGTNLPNQGFLTNSSFDFSNRTFSISYSTSFGNKKLKASRDRITGSEEERKRVN